MLISRFNDYNLRLMASFDMFGLRDSLRSDRLRMTQDYCALFSFKQSISRFGISMSTSSRKVSLSRAISTFPRRGSFPPASYGAGRATAATANVAGCNFAFANEANTAAERPARETFVYGYMRGLRKRI